MGKFKGKEIHVALVGDAKITFLELEEIIMQEHREGKIGTDKQKIFNSIKRAIELLKQNPHHGVHIPKKNIPHSYRKEYPLGNLWKCDLAHFWRLIYWIDGSEVKIVSFVIDIIDHEVYNKRFGYRKS